VDLHSAFIVAPHTQGVESGITQFYLQITPHLLHLVSIHQLAPLLIALADI